jgi:hypothetical protein
MKTNFDFHLYTHYIPFDWRNVTLSLFRLVNNCHLSQIFYFFLFAFARNSHEIFSDAFLLFYCLVLSDVLFIFKIPLLLYLIFLRQYSCCRLYNTPYDNKKHSKKKHNKR